MTETRKVKQIEVFALSCAVDGGPVSTLALMPVRNGLLIRIEDEHGAFGWGEAWCNYPPKGNVAKLNLMQDPIGPMLVGRDVSDWRGVRPKLENELARMMIHTGEFGPFAHCLAAIDMAVADMAARVAGVPMSRMLAEDPLAQAQVYASSPSAEAPEELAARLTSEGHSGVKIKIGFDPERDRDVLSRFRAHDSQGMFVGVDANQNWRVGQAITAISDLAGFDLGFVEEPIMADAPRADWVRVAQLVDVPLAGGENVTSASQFADHVTTGSLKVIQPDVAKWGGISGCFDAGRHALAHGAGVTLHYMGTALGLAASFHVLAALKADGRVELDANPNPLRTDLGDIALKPTNGYVPLPEGAGFGFVPDLEALKRFSVATITIKE
ncbi:L-alanine-DL-glutamate epimerase [Aliiroseovarius halocynthiae]|nr:mandelate racemase/muconate lactonizing enzyme family protein [Aliiroseovarius halocynthiae]SMR83940.1 L-alanine-DL-glutamate epimerase [Aliiroseovarius halocynthiae]